MKREAAPEAGTLSAGTVLLRLFVLCSPLLLNDLYLPLVPKDAHRLNLVLDVLVYIAWQSTVIYLAFQARWFSLGDLGITSEDLPRQILWGIMLLILVLILYVMLLFVLKYAGKLFDTKLSFTWYFPLPDWKPVPVFFYVLYLSITAGVYEEIVYRGIVISLLRRRHVAAVGARARFGPRFHGHPLVQRPPDMGRGVYSRQSSGRISSSAVDGSSP